MELSLEKMNLLLANLQYIDGKELSFVEKREIRMGVSDDSYSSEGVQGEEDNYYQIYKINSEDNLFLQVEYYTDSYGSNEAIRGVKFVKGVNKTVLDFESIK